MPIPALVNPGDRYGRLTLLRRVENRNTKRMWLCRCDCGTEGVRELSHLRSGHTRSCGCADTHRGGLTHGLSDTQEYRIWAGIKTRCLNPGNKEYAYYGGRGITICEEWKENFQAFYDHVGSRPSVAHSIDRKDNNGNYEPGNVRWATPLVQGRNSRRAKRITFRGETRCIGEWSEILGLNYHTLRTRIKRWPIELAMTRPAGRWAHQ